WQLRRSWCEHTGLPWFSFLLMCGWEQDECPSTTSTMSPFVLSSSGPTVPCWMGPWAAWAGLKCGGWWPCLWWGGWSFMILQVPSNPGHSVIH
uniref:Uncharacterized protein n=1 Tax=Pavo cristatus TaxID=9049 RepID=A0A8C9EX82_PAVCR